LIIPIFDSLTHPTLNGDWLPGSPVQNNTVESLLHNMGKSDVQWAFAINMGKNRVEQTADYINCLKKNSPQLFPVGYLEPDIHLDDIENYVTRLKRLGYVGIKIHPRLARLRYEDEIVNKAVEYAQKNKMIIFICTYYVDRSPLSPFNHLGALHSLLCRWPNAYIILLHGGGSQLLQLTEISQNFPNVLVDLSFTLCRYEGSSVDLDIEYLFKRYDKRICIGSDSPEYSQEQLRERFEYFAKKTTREKATNIAHSNLVCLLTHINVLSVPSEC